MTLLRDAPGYLAYFGAYEFVKSSFPKLVIIANNNNIIIIICNNPVIWPILEHMNL